MSEGIMLRILRVIAVCTAGVAAAAATAAAASKPTEDTLLRRSRASPIVEQVDHSEPAHGNFFDTKHVEPKQKRPRSHTREVRQVQDPSTADTVARIDPNNLMKQRTALHLCQRPCRRCQWMKASTSRQRHPSRTMQQLSRQQQEHALKKHRKRQQFPTMQEHSGLTNQEHRTERLLARHHEMHKLMHEGELQKQIPPLQVQPLQQQKQEEQCDGQHHPDQQERQQQHSSHARRQNLERVKTLHPQGIQKRQHKPEVEAIARQEVSRKMQQQQQQGFWEMKQLHNTPQHMQELHARQPSEESQMPQQQQKLISLEGHQSQVLSIIDVPKEISDPRATPRVLQHIVQRQVLDFDVPAEQQLHDHVRGDEERDPGKQQVQPVEGVPDSASDVRGQEQKVLWGGKVPDVQLPQQVNLSQVLIQNSPQLFFNYDQPQQRGGSKKKREDGSAGQGEYNWQQHVRGQPGRSDGEQQQREQEEQQEQLKRQQQQLLGEVFALGRDIDRGQQQLMEYQKLRQQLQILHLLQLQLVQQLKLSRKQGNKTVKDEQQNLQQQDGMQHDKQRQSITPVSDNKSSLGSCSVDNYPLFESFLQWDRVQRASEQLLALNSDILAAAHIAGEISTISFPAPSTPDFSGIGSDASSSPLGGSDGPGIGTVSFVTDTSSPYQMRQIKFALKELVPPPRMWDLGKASHSRAAQEPDETQNAERSEHQKETSGHKQKPHVVERLPQPQQKAGHSSQQLAQRPFREADVEPSVGDNKQQGGEQGKSLMEHRIDYAAHNSTTSLFSDGLHSPLFPLLHELLEHSATGRLAPAAPTENPAFMPSHLENPSQVFTRSLIKGKCTKLEDRKHQEHGQQGYVQSGQGGKPVDMDESPRAESVLLRLESDGDEVNQVSTSAAGRKSNRMASLVANGTVNEDNAADRQQRESDDRVKQQPLDALVQSVPEMPPVTASSQPAALPTSVEEKEGESRTILKTSVTSVKAEVFPDRQRASGKRHSERRCTGEKVGARQMTRRTICPGRKKYNGGASRTTPAARTTTTTGGTGLEIGDGRCGTSPGCEEHKQPQERRQHCGKISGATVQPDDGSESLPKAKARLDTAAEAVHEQDFSGLQESLREQESFAKPAESMDPASQLHPEETLRRLEQEKEQYREKLASLIDRVEQQQEELDQRKRALQQQKEELTKLRGTVDSEIWERQHQSLLDSHALLQETGEERQFMKKATDEEIKNSKQHHFGRPLTRLNKISRGRTFNAPVSGFTSKPLGASSSRALQLFSRSIFGVPESESTLSLCRTPGEPCAPGTICCEDLQCFIPVNNSQGTARPDGRGTCQPGRTAAIPTSVFRLPIQLDPVIPQRVEPGIGATTHGSLLSGNEGLLRGEEGSSPFRRSVAALRLPDATAASGAEVTGALASTSQGMTRGALWDENSTEGSDGIQGISRAGFAGQYRLPSNSRTLTRTDGERKHL